MADVGQERRGERGGVGGEPAADELEYLCEFESAVSMRVRGMQVPKYHDNERWVILWQPRGDDALLIAYIGRENFRSSYI